MIAVVEEKIDALQALCRRHRVARLEVFGSAATGDFDPASSDLDFVVDFGEVPAGERFDHYFAFQEALAALFGRPVDLIEDGAVRNPFLQKRINESRRVVYAA